MTDPLSEVITLLRPRTVFAKGISGAGAWGVRYTDFGEPSFCTVLEGSCRLHVDGQEPITLEASDFVLLPATPGFVISGFEPVTPEVIDPKTAAPPVDEVRHGRPDGDPDVRLLGGYFVFDSPDAELLVSLLPALVHMRGADRLTTLTRLLGEEAREQNHPRDGTTRFIVDHSRPVRRLGRYSEHLYVCAGRRRFVRPEAWRQRKSDHSRSFTARSSDCLGKSRLKLRRRALSHELKLAVRNLEVLARA